MHGGLAFGVALAGCSRAEKANSQPNQGATDRTSKDAPKSMTVYRDPSCGCCEAWASIAQKSGYAVTLLDDPNMAAVKQRLGVPPELASCHTAQIGEYVVEGHVPLDQVARMLRGRPSGLRGIAVPGMPLGSPGMEVPGGTKEPYQVIAFFKDGRTSVFES